MEDQYYIENDLNSDSGSDLVISSKQKRRLRIESEESESETGNNLVFVRLLSNTDFSNETSNTFIEITRPRHLLL